MAKASKSKVIWAEVGSAALGAAVGGVLGLLFSPNSGKKNRGLIAKEGKKASVGIKKTVKDVSGNLKKAAKTVEAKATKITKKKVVARKK